MGKKLPVNMCKLLDNYLDERRLIYETKVVNKNIALSAGVPQGSVLSPTLWNILYDDLLHKTMPEEVELIAYADDVAITATAKNKPQIERLLEQAAKRVIEWLQHTGIELAIQKTETILFTKKRNNRINIMIRGHPIQSKESIKYLGLQLDKYLNFNEHAAWRPTERMRQRQS